MQQPDEKRNEEGVRISEYAMVHIRPGDDILPLLSASGLPGAFIKWADPLFHGPIPSGLSPDERRAARTKFISETYDLSYEEVLQGLLKQDTDLGQFGEHDRIVLWFEHDLFCQIILIYLMNWFSEHPLGKTKLFLICIGAHPEIEDFRGLSQLNPAQLARLYETAQKVTEAQRRLAQKAWRAFASHEPLQIEALTREETTALPFLRGAFHRHLQQFPSVRNGLNLTERHALEIIASGETRPERIFKEAQKREGETPWLTDGLLWSHLKSMAEGEFPLLTLQGSGPWPNHAHPSSERTVGITSIGRRVLAGELDFIRLHGIDRWLGGVYLRGEEAQWRWDEQRRRLVQRR